MAHSASKSALLPVSVALFSLGLLAIVIIFGLYAAGHQNLPVWLNVVALLAPLGLVTGVVGVVLQARDSA